MPLLSRTWPASASLPRLCDGEAQLWYLDLHGRAAEELLECCWPNLAAEERSRAERIRVDHARQEFLVGRGVLRLLLEAATGVAAARIPLAVGEFGKPWVKLAGAPECNLSHSHGMVLIALSRAGAVGVDIEWLDPSIDPAELARSTFHPNELLQLDAAVGKQARLECFYKLWTRKEALAKASGMGIGLKFSALDTADERIAEHGEQAREASFRVRSLEPILSSTGLRFAAAMASPQALIQINSLCWPGLSDSPVRGAG